MCQVTKSSDAVLVKMDQAHQVTLPIPLVDEVSGIGNLTVCHCEWYPSLLCRVVLLHKGHDGVEVDVLRVKARRGTEDVLEGHHEIIKVMALVLGTRSDGGLGLVRCETDGHDDDDDKNNTTNDEQRLRWSVKNLQASGATTMQTSTARTQ